MYCRQCGAKIPEGSSFCSQCGAPVKHAADERGAASEPVPAPEPVPVPTDDTASIPGAAACVPAQEEAPATGHVKGRVPVVVGTVAAVLLACAGVALGLHYSGALGANDPLASLGGAKAQPAKTATKESGAKAMEDPAKSDAGEKDTGDSAEAVVDAEDSSSSGAAAAAQPARTKTLTVVRQAMTWSDARDYCESHGGELACITSETEWSQAKSLMDQSDCSVFWIGGTRSASGGFAWLDGSSWDYQQWASGEPNDDGGEENFVAVLKSHGNYAWYDVPGDVSSYYKPEKMAFIMQMES